MCGIAGVVGVREGRVDETRLVRMRDTMIHRGPDGCGVWHDASRRVGIAHRRLAIVDLTDAGAQPMATEDGRLRLVYNGEIYNHVELRGELEALGHRFRGRSDSEVVLRGFQQWGGDLLRRLVGMFAFAIWNSETETLLVARDRVGIKPLYFTCAAGEFLFASEIKALLADPAVSPELDPLSAWHYLTFLVPPAPLTMFRDIYKLPAGHFLSVSSGQAPRMERWWDPRVSAAAEADPTVYRSEDSCREALLDRLDRSIERRMMSDVPFGVFLSGGVDSSANVALMARHMDRPVETFSVGFKGHEAYNELGYARQVARTFRTNHHEILIDDVDMQEYLPQLVHQQDEPIADWVCVPLYYVSKLARDNGVIVVQVGEGSDELFCGYDHFREPLDLQRRYGRPLGLLPGPLRRGVVGLAQAAGRFSESWARRAETADRIARGEEIFWGGAVCYRGDLKDEVWSGPNGDGRTFPDFVPQDYRTFDSGAVVRQLTDRFRRENPGADFYQAMLYLELRMRLPELLLMRVDKITMSTSVESRVPFLDQDLVDFGMGLPMKMRLRANVGKYILKKAMRGILPDEVIDRKKMGFGAPVREWLHGPFGKFARDRLLGRGAELFDATVVRRMLDEHESGRANRSFELWVLLNFVLWYRHWILGESV